MLNSPFKSQALGPSEPSLRWTNSASVSVQRLIIIVHTHRGRPDFTNASFLGDGTDLIDESIRIFEFFPAGLEDRALRRRLELVRPRLAHRFRGDPLLTRTGPVVNKQRRVHCCRCRWAVFLFFFFLERNPVCFTVGLGGSQSSSTWEAAAYTHRACTYTHKHTVARTHIHAQRGECSKAVSTSAQKTRYHLAANKACQFPRCPSLTSTL